jgi:hypothetical protein
MCMCVICRFQVELDDAVLPTSNGGCICVRCFARETETEVPLSKSLRKELMEVLAEAEAV